MWGTSSIDDLPPVSNMSNISQQLYYNITTAFKNDEMICSLGMNVFQKVEEWCKYLKCPPCDIPPYPNKVEKASPFIKNSTEFRICPHSGTPAKCYDDFLCDDPDRNILLYYTLGITSLILCIGGFLANLVCLAAFNVRKNRTGATLYLSTIIMLDNIYLAIYSIFYVYHYMTPDYDEQLRRYNKNIAKLVSWAFPFLTFSELGSVWLLVSLLWDRHSYLLLGYFSSVVTSRVFHTWLTVLVISLSLGYATPKMFEFKSVYSTNFSVYCVELTDIGKSSLFRNLMDHWLKVPLEMFLPYLFVGVLTLLTSSKMADFEVSKWRDVATLCLPKTYRTCCCSDEFAECTTLNFKTSKAPSLQESEISLENKTNVINTNRTETQLKYYCGITFQRRSSILPLYFVLPPPQIELREDSNIVIAVCLGFLLLCFKLPKLIIHVLTTENYIAYSPTLVTITCELLNLLFLICKPLVYLFVGVHLRHALTGMFCCACLYTPRVNHQFCPVASCMAAEMPLPASINSA